MEILYPIAYDDGRSLIHISDAPKVGGLRYTCVHCGDRMVAAVHATKVPKYFRHHTEACDPYNYLHTAAIETVRQAHSDAVKREDAYNLTRPCWNCGAFSTEIDLADEWKCTKEHSIVEHTRSDLVFSHTAGRRIIVEVVVTHNMEPETRSAYENAGIPVAILRPALETLNNLSSSLHIKDSLNFGSNRCFRCEEERYNQEPTTSAEKAYKAIQQIRNLAAEGYGIEEIQSLTASTQALVTGMEGVGWTREAILKVVDAETRKRLLRVSGGVAVGKFIIRPDGTVDVAPPPAREAPPDPNVQGQLFYP